MGEHSHQRMQWTPLERTEEMEARTCGWMSGPDDPAVTVSSVKWWIAVSRGTLARDYVRQLQKTRPPVTCRRTPAFVSPLSTKAS